MFVLKIIGFVILILICLLLLLLLAVLLVPVRYRVGGSYYGKLKGFIRITWLLHMVSAVISYDGETSMKVRLFWIFVVHPGARKAKRTGKAILEEAQPEIPAAGKAAKEISKKVKKAVSPSSGRGEPETAADPKGLRDCPPPDGKEEKEGGSAFQEKRGFLNHLAVFFSKWWKNLTGLPGRLSRTCRRIVKMAKRLAAGIRKGLTNVEDLKLWFQDSENQKLLRLIWRHTKALLRHGLPRRVKGRVTFGFDDPYTTGQVLSAAAVLYPFYGKKIRIFPVFDRVIFEAEGTIKGRIRAATVLIRLFGAYRNKTLKALIRKWLR